MKYTYPFPLIGREEEKALLDELLAQQKPQLVAVYGRRRVGKTFLLRNYLRSTIVFHFSGIHNVDTVMQLEQFSLALAQQLNGAISLPVPANWFEAFHLLIALLKKLRRSKKVILLDEFPWLQTPKSNFLPAFEQFWNGWCTLQHNLVVIVCGSSASWMIKEVIRNKGGLHNRITQKIALQPFRLSETALFLQSRGVHLNHYQIVQLYMAFGGIPLYLEKCVAGMSATQIIDKECFSKNGFLYHEFTDLYKALFDMAERHLSVVRALAAKPMGLTRNQLIKACKLQSGGSTSALLDELSASGFITPYVPFNKKLKDSIYKLTDAFSLFYLKFMEPNRAGGKGTWERLSDTPSWKSWSGLAFENICLQHEPAIRKKLGILGIYTEKSCWKSRQRKDGAQIDLVINRRDNCINLCEIKYYDGIFTVDKKYAAVLAQKKHLFKSETKTKKHCFITLITTYGIHNNEHSVGLVDHSIALEAFF
jgi:hypothetical protein